MNCWKLLVIGFVSSLLICIIGSYDLIALFLGCCGLDDRSLAGI